MSNSDFQPNQYQYTPTTHTDTYSAINPAQFAVNHKNHIVLISGASKGIGRETALSFARAGAKGIILLARSNLSDVESAVLAAAKESGHSPEVLTLSGVDVTDSASVAKVAKQVADKFGGRLDVLVNNAGYLETWKPLAETDEQDWWATWEINVKGLYLVTRALLPLMLDSQSEGKDSNKTIINVSSVGALHTRLGASAYQSTKFAVMRLTEFLDVEYADKGIASIAIHPGGVMTSLAANMPKELHAVLVDTPNLAADTIVWLTAKRRDWASGRYISVKWDMPELEAVKDQIVEGDKLKMKLVV